MREVVVLPQPDSPTRPNVSPALMSKETSSTALMWPSVRENRMPLVKAKCLRRPSTRSNGWPHAARLPAISRVLFPTCTVSG